MSYNIVFLAPASEELEDAFHWYEKRKPGLGYELIDELQEYFDLISENPLLFVEQQNRANLHKVPLKRFPFCILYWISVEKEVVYIDAVFHSKRKPK